MMVFLQDGAVVWGIANSDGYKRSAAALVANNAPSASASAPSIGL